VLFLYYFKLQIFLNVFLTLDTESKGLDVPILLHDDGSIREVVRNPSV